MNVLLINPFRYTGRQINVGVDPVVTRHAGQEIKTGFTLPIGLCYIGAVLLKNGYQVKILDPVPQKLSIKEIYDTAAKSDAIIMPFSPAHSQATVKFLMDFKGRLRILTGGVARYFPEQLFEKDICEAIVYGEPELTILELIKRFPEIEGVKGTFYRKDGKIIQAPPRPFIDSLDELPFPARHLVDQRLYWDIFFLGEPTTWVITSRGCSYDCIFCAEYDTYGKNVRFRNPERVVDEIGHVKRDYGINNFAFFDPNFNMSNSHVVSICREIIKRKLKFRWWCAGRADLIKPDTVQLMKEAGCQEIRIGLEAANDDILKYLKKSITVEKFLTGIDILKRERMNFSLHCIFGSLPETMETVNNTVKMVKSLRPLFVSFNLLTPMPGSQLFLQQRDRLKLEDIASFNLIHTENSFCDFSDDALKRILRYAYRAYYFSPGFLLTVFGRLVTKPGDFFRMCGTLFRQGVYIMALILDRKTHDET